MALEVVVVVFFWHPLGVLIACSDNDNRHVTCQIVEPVAISVAFLARSRAVQT